MDYLHLAVEALELIGISYLSWRAWFKKPPDLRQVLARSLEARLETGGGLRGRERLRTRLAAKLAEKA